MKSWAFWSVLVLVVAMQVGLLVAVSRNGKVTDAIAHRSGVPASLDRTLTNSQGAQVAHVHTEWKSGSIPIVIDLYQNDDESSQEFAMRAAQFINDMKVAFPPNP